jgi:hypothetical protein
MMTTTSDLARAYRQWRALKPDVPASTALQWARYELAQRAALARFGEWTFERGAYGAFAHADLSDVASPYVVRVLVGDDDQPIDWGDCEPTEEEREHASAYYVAIQVLDSDGSELYHDGIGGVDVIDLPGYLQRDWEDAAAYALIEYLLAGAETFARVEPAERAYWAARDVVTVER